MRIVRALCDIPMRSLWLVIALPMTYGGLLDLTIVHTNDVHARFDETNAFGGRCPENEAKVGKCFGGMARLKTKVDEIRRRDKNTLFLDAGDYYQGTLYFNEFSYNITSDFNNRLQYDAVSLGNHEFDLGVEGLIPYLDQVKFPVLACNLNLDKEPRLQGKMTCARTFKFDGEDVAVLGFITPETTDLSSPGNVGFTDEVQVLQAEVNKLIKNGINKIIALGHSGYTVDKDIAKKVKGLDVVVGGHSNTFLYTGTPPTVDPGVMGPYPTVITQEDGSKVLVVQDYAYAKYLGYLRVQFDSDGKVVSWAGNPILLDSAVKKDQEMVDALAPYKKRVESLGSRVVGQSLVLLRGDQCRLKECNIGNLMADACVRYYSKASSKEGWAKQSIALWNSGGIRASIDERLNDGNITMEDVLTVFPFGNSADLAGLYGRHLKQAMEWSVSKYNIQNPPGGFLQVSGLKVSYCMNRPPGQRLVSLKALCNRCRVPRYLEVEDDKVYHLVLPTFMLDGGDGYKMIKDNAVDVFKTGVWDVDVLLQELNRSSPLTSSEEGRIVFLTEECNNSNSSPRRSVSILVLVVATFIAATAF